MSNEPLISRDPEIIKAVWGIKPYTIWQIMCSCCGGIHTYDMPLQDIQEDLIDQEWEFRRTGPWCPGCCEDQRRRVEEIMEGSNIDAREAEASNQV